MTKDEFLAQVQQRLRVLEAAEQRDILDEYAQHIDMQMAAGKTEEEAIQDFGDLDELLEDILGAYHVNPDYLTEAFAPVQSNNACETAAPTVSPETFEAAVPVPKKRGLGKIKGAAGKFGAKRKTSSFGAKRKAAKAQEAYEKALNPTSLADDPNYSYYGLTQPLQEAADEVAAAQADLLSSAQAVAAAANPAVAPMTAAASAVDPAAAVQIPPQILLPAAPVKPKREKKQHNVSGGLKSFFKLIWRGLKACCRWIWNLCIACVAASFAVTSAACVFCFGTLLVMSFMGYPFIGVSIALLGGTVFCAAATLLLGTVFMRKKKEVPEAPEQAQDEELVLEGGELAC